MIPVSEPLLGQRELDNVVECVRTGWISSAGRFLEEFEQRWAGYCGRRHGVAVCNGTAALHAAAASLDLQPGDEVILPTFTIMSCALAVLYAGGTPVLVDADPGTWTMDPDQVAAKISPRTRAIMAVHIYGHPAPMGPLLELAHRHGLALLEDAAEAHGAECRTDTWRRCGGFGDLSAFSFFANKIITTGEGGMVLTDDAARAEKVRAFRNLCFQPGRRFYHEELGHNFRMTNLQAALGCAQLARIDEFIARKRRLAAEYTRRLRGLGSLQLPTQAPWARSVYWMYGVVLTDDAGRDARELAQELRRRGVETRPFFLGLHEQPALRRRGLFGGERYPVAERLARQGLYLPSGLALSDDQVARVCDGLREVLS